MNTRHSLVRSSNRLIASAFFGASLLMLPLAHAQNTLAKPVSGPKDDASATPQQPWYGMLNDDNVYIRSGPSDDKFYATAKLNKGAKVTVVGIKEDWLKIMPPEGSYCYVAKAYVEKRGDGTVGRVTKPDLNVRAGSLLNSFRTTVQTSLEEGDDVKILGEEQDYFKIAPPPGAYLYVKKTYVEPAPQLASNIQTPAPAPVTAQPQPPQPRMQYPIASEPVPPVVAAPVVAAPAVAPPVVISPLAVLDGATGVTGASGGSVDARMALPTTKPATAVATPGPSTTQPTSVAIVPTTKPVEATADEKFGTLESAFLDATSEPLDRQPIDSLLSQYAQLSTDPALPVTMRHIADRRIAVLKVRSAARKDQIETLKMQADARERQLALTAENKELVQRIKDNEVSVYSALGTLRISSLQQTGATMYRLTDPGTGRTLLYIRSNDDKYAGMLGKFIGVKGDITEDTNLSLKVINPTATEVVDPAKVNTTVTATVIPPSLLAKTATASVTGN